MLWYHPEVVVVLLLTPFPVTVEELCTDCLPAVMAAAVLLPVAVALVEAVVPVAVALVEAVVPAAVALVEAVGIEVVHTTLSPLVSISLLEEP